MTQGFACIPHNVDDAGISDFAYRLYGRLKRHNNTIRGSFPGQETLAKEMGVSISKIERAMKELRDRHCIVVERRGRGQTNVYRFADDPSLVTDQEPSPVTDQEQEPSPVTDQNTDDPSDLKVLEPSLVKVPIVTRTSINNRDTITANAVMQAPPASPNSTCQSVQLHAGETPPTGGARRDTPYQFMLVFYEKMGTSPPADQRTKSKCLGQAKLLLERGATADDLDSLIESCAWARDVDMGTLLANYEKWRIGQHHQPTPAPKLTGRVGESKRQFERLVNIARGDAR